MMEDDEEAELQRPDTWMQSMVPSLPKPFAILCLVLNLIIPGLGTFTGGVLSCCIGRPRIDFRPARFRCPTALLVMFVGIAQFVATAFFLVGWLWSILWGFLMLNLSDPKFRALPPPPLAKHLPASRTPSVKIEVPPEDASAGRKNFNRLIHKATANKEVALGLKSASEPSQSNIFKSCRPNRTSSLKCLGKSNNNSMKTSKSETTNSNSPKDAKESTDSKSDKINQTSRSESKQQLLEEEAGNSMGKKGSALFRAFRRVLHWKRRRRTSGKHRIVSAKEADAIPPTTSDAKSNSKLPEAGPNLARRNSLFPGSQSSSAPKHNGLEGNNVFVTPPAATPNRETTKVTKTPPRQSLSAAKLSKETLSTPAVIITGPNEAKTIPEEKNETLTKENRPTAASQPAKKQNDQKLTSTATDKKESSNNKSKPDSRVGSTTKLNSDVDKRQQNETKTNPTVATVKAPGNIEALPKTNPKPNEATTKSTTAAAYVVKNPPVTTESKAKVDKSDKTPGNNLTETKPVTKEVTAAKSEAEARMEQFKENETKYVVPVSDGVTLIPGDLQRPMKPRHTQSFTYHFEA